jgi:hypothetical protein
MIAFFPETIDNIFKLHLQKNITLSLNGKPHKSGKFLLYSFSDFFIEIDIDTKNKIKKIPVPLPFHVEHYENEGLVFFDYRLQSLSKQNIIKRSSKSKFYNTILEIQFE